MMGTSGKPVSRGRRLDQCRYNYVITRHPRGSLVAWVGLWRSGWVGGPTGLILVTDGGGPSLKAQNAPKCP